MIEEVDEKRVPENRYPEKYFLVHENFLYPPKYLIAIANRYANSVELDPAEFAGFELEKIVYQKSGRTGAKASFL